MKKIIFILASLSLLMSGCNKEYDEVLDESVLSELPSFEYAGYTYYVHPRLAVFDSWVEYKDIEKSVQLLDSYGYRSWFVPSLNELEQAAKAGYLSSVFNMSKLYHISSSKNDGEYLCLWWSGSGWEPIVLNNYYYGYYTCSPMIKFRKQIQ